MLSCPGPDVSGVVVVAAAEEVVNRGLHEAVGRTASSSG